MSLCRGIWTNLSSWNKAQNYTAMPENCDNSSLDKFSRGSINLGANDPQECDDFKDMQVKGVSPFASQ